MSIAGKPGGQNLIIFNQLRHIAAVNFPLITRLIDIAGHPRFFIQLRLAVGDDRLTAFGGHNVVGRTACQQHLHHWLNSTAGGAAGSWLVWRA